jgi:hypothetical protein
VSLKPAALLLLLAGCTADLQIPAGARLTCAANADCPSGFVCRERVGCVPADALTDLIPPELVAASIQLQPSLATDGTPLEVRFEVNERLFEAPEVKTPTLAGDLLWELHSTEGTRYVFRHTVGPADPESPLEVVVSLTDVARNEVSGLSLGRYGVDRTAPTLRSAQPSAAEVKRDDGLGYTVQLDEPVGQLPQLRVKHGGVLLDGFFSAAAPTRPQTSFSWSHPVKDTDADGAYTVELELADEAGNKLGPISIPGFTIDASAPQLNNLTVSPRRVGTQGTVTVGFETSEALPDSGGVSVTVAGTASSCSLASASSPPRYTCTYAATGAEVAAGAESSRSVAVRLTDAAGNRREGSETVLFDRKPPAVAFAAVAYRPPAGHPLGLVTAATAGTELVVQLSASEELAATPPVLSARLGGYVLSFVLKTLDSSSATFSAVVDAAAPDGEYTPVLDWSDAVGNRDPAATFTAQKLLVKTSKPTLAVLQSEVSYLRSPWGSSEERLDGGFTVPAGPYFALAPADSLDGRDTLPASTFSLGAAPPQLVRVWGDEEKKSLLGTVGALDGGAWPRARLANLDAPAIYASGVDHAGNESPLVKVENAEWVATPKAPPFGASPHAVVATRTVDPWLTVDSDSSFTSSEAETPDGTALLARAEMAWRERARSSDVPEARVWGKLAYDSRRGRVVLFGGYDASNIYLQSLWEWDGRSWERKSPPGSKPTARYGHGLAYDAWRGRVVLYGGSDGVARQDLWEWDGTRWEQRPLSGPLPPVREHSMVAYDLARKRLVLFGGYNGVSGPLADLWEWDGARWEQRTPAGPKPSARSGHALGYDPVRSRVVLFGGWANGANVADLWEWDGTAWEQKSPSGVSPPPGSELTFTFDTQRSRLLLVGGYHEWHSVWEWDGTGWVNRSPALPALQPRAAPAIVYDPARRELLLFAGESSLPVRDLWSFDGTAWTERTPQLIRPWPRSRHAMVHDPARGRVVLFGGVSEEIGGHQDTWEWDGARWIDRTGTGPRPSARYWHAMAYDAARARVVLFGGTDGSNNQDVWEWDGSAWADRTPAGTKPPGRYAHRMAYDATRQRVVVFGGTTGTGYFQDLWEWNGASWVDRSAGVTPKPPARAWGGLAYDTARQKLVLFGGNTGGLDYLQDTWEWDGSGWTLRTPPAPLPVARAFHELAYDSARARTVMFGGFGATSAPELWEWDGLLWTRKPQTQAEITVGNRAQFAMVYESGRQRLLLFGGREGIASDDTWELDPGPARQPAVQVQLSAAGASNGAGVSAAQPYLAGPPAALLSWTSASEEEARRLLLERDRQVSFQCRPAGSSGIHASEAAVALDSLELRVRYQP